MTLETQGDKRVAKPVQAFFEARGFYSLHGAVPPPAPRVVLFDGHRYRRVRVGGVAGARVAWYCRA